MTILTQRVGEGPTRRCDTNCHFAKHAECNCICGGRYHGARHQAQQRITEDFLGKDWDDIKAAMPNAKGLMIAGGLQQLALPVGEA
jgi:hypothetical protein